MTGPPRSPLIEISDPLRDRYASLKLIEWWDQTRLREACVLVAGAGAIGNEVLKNLALLGVGRLLIVDCDTIEASNLTRSLLYRAEDVGRSKAQVAARRVQSLNPDVEAVPLHADLTTELGLGYYRQANVVLGCLDNRAARFAVNRATQRAGVPWIDAAMDVLMGMVRIFVPSGTCCYECLMSDVDYRLLHVRYSCPHVPAGYAEAGRIPTTPTTAAIIAGMQVQEAIRLLHGHDVPAGKGIYYNGVTHSLSLISYVTRDDCPAHEIWAPVPPVDSGSDITVGALCDLLRGRFGEHLVLLPDQEIVRALYCPACSTVESVWHPFDSVIRPGDARSQTAPAIGCPACGANRVPDVVTRVGSAAAPVPLRQLGVPDLAVVRVEDAAGRTHYIELAGGRDGKRQPPEQENRHVQIR